VVLFFVPHKAQSFMNKEIVSFENLPQAVSLLLDKVENLEQLLKSQQNPASPSDRPMSITEAAKFLNLSVPTLYGFVSKRTIPFSKLGKRLYFSEAELTTWVKSGRKQNCTEIVSQPALVLMNNKSNR